MRAETLHQTILLAIVAGLALSIYAWYETINPAAQAGCSIYPWLSCGAVARSGHTTTLGIQDYWFGIVGFGLMLGIDIPLYRSWNRRLLVALLLVAGAGLGAAVYPATIETFIIGAFCPVCLSTYVADAIVFFAALALYRRGRATDREEAVEDASPSAAEPDSATA